MVDVLSYASTNVGTSSYVTLDASLPGSCSGFVIVDTSTQLIKLAVGAVGHEVDIAVFQGNGYPVTIQNKYLAPGVRLSLKAISASATTGYICVSYFG